MTGPADALCVLVADDEAPARKRLRDLLSKDREIGRILEAENGVDAVSLLESERPDILFLDVQMPGIDGFGVIDAVGADRLPLTIFVTAYDQFALRAFEADALDYLLKPFGDTRYEQTIKRAKKRLRTEPAERSRTRSLGPETMKLVAGRDVPGALWDWLVVRDRNKTRLVCVDDIDWIEASDVYVTLHLAAENLLHRASLATLASRLDPAKFVRIQRSALVNLRSIALLERRSHGEFDVVVRDGSRLMLSRKYKANLESLLGQSL